MASLQVEVRPGARVYGYSLFVDGVPPAMDADHRGEVSCAGRCGDGSRHSLLYSFTGAAGATLGIVLRCRGREVCRIAAARIPEGAARYAGRRVFDL
ncbi:MAG TPA: hypothetical protein VEA61_13285 [Allosphingosinicella sp.]|nr:hypothetical protein [Allosphingosinicella sp.]